MYVPVDDARTQECARLTPSNPIPPSELCDEKDKYAPRQSLPFCDMRFPKNSKRKEIK